VTELGILVAKVLVPHTIPTSGMVPHCGRRLSNQESPLTGTITAASVYIVTSYQNGTFSKEGTIRLILRKCTKYIHLWQVMHKLHTGMRTHTFPDRHIFVHLWFHIDGQPAIFMNITRMWEVTRFNELKMSLYLFLSTPWTDKIDNLATWRSLFF